MVTVAVLTHLAYPPTLAHIIRNCAIDRRDTLFAARGRRKKEVVVYVIEHEAGHKLCILQIALLPVVLLLRRQRLLQQQLSLPKIADTVVHPYDKVIAPLPGEVLQRQPVALVAVLLCEHEHLVPVPVVKADAVRDNVVDLRIIGVEEPFNRHLAL